MSQYVSTSLDIEVAFTMNEDVVVVIDRSLVSSASWDTWRGEGLTDPVAISFASEDKEVTFQEHIDQGALVGVVLGPGF
jgi:hypothetical protein